MKGNNELRLCPATVMEVVQEWVNKNIASKPIVTDVRSLPNENSFVVKLKEAETKEAA